MTMLSPITPYIVLPRTDVTWTWMPCGRGRPKKKIVDVDMPRTQCTRHGSRGLAVSDAGRFGIHGFSPFD